MADLRAVPGRHSRRRRRPSRGRGAGGLRLALTAILLILAEAQLAPVRWWQSPRVVRALGLTSIQSDALDRVYQQSVPAGQTASLQVMQLTERIVEALRDRRYDDELLRTTAALVRARDEECELRRRALGRAVAALQPGQQRELSRLLAAREIID